MDSYTLVRNRNEDFEPGPALRKEDVERRVEDWLKRLTDLFSQIEKWASETGWTVNNAMSTVMNGPLMQQFNIPARQQPVLRLDRDTETYALFKPKALWLIEANGRIDLYTSTRVFDIIDQAERFEKPQWMLFRGPTKEGDRFTPELINRLI